MSESPAGSFWSIVGTTLLHGSSILLLLLLATLLGWIAGVDGIIECWLGGLMGERFSHELPGAISWLIAVLIAFGLPFLLLSCNCGWQRMTVWIASIAILALWAPVLSLAAYHPAISLPWIAAALAGLLVTLHLYWSARKRAR